MNKTVTINISGIIFHIEEDAYQNLSAYLAALKVRFAATEGGTEILADIESRIAELLQQNISASKQVILNADVEAVKSTMGRPEDLGGDDQAKPNGDPRVSHEPVKRRLFRDPEDKVIGGVCSGLAAYFDVDRVWIRLAMFLLIFFGGISLWVYIILWLVIPEAKSTADRLAMRGQPANINTIIQNFKDEAVDVKNRAVKYGHEFNRDYGDRVRDNMSGVLGTFFNIVGRFIGFILLLIGTTLLIGFVAALTGISFIDLNPEVANWKVAIFENGFDYALAILAFILFFGVPVFGLLYAGVKLLFRIRYSNRWLNVSCAVLWIVGILLGVFVAVKTTQHFTETSRIREVADLHETGDTIVIKMRYTPELHPAGGKDSPYRHGQIRIGKNDKAISITGCPSLDVSESHDGKTELQVSLEARGADKHSAYENAKAIRYRYERLGNEIILDENFIVEDDTRFRSPKVRLHLYIPVGKVVYFDRSVKTMLDDVDNTLNIWSGNMAGRRWKMTSTGLTCIDCDGLEEEHDIHKRHRKHIRINRHGIEVKENDGEVIIDRDGISVTARDSEKK